MGGQPVGNWIKKYAENFGSEWLAAIRLRCKLLDKISQSSSISSVVRRLTA